MSVIQIIHISRQFLAWSPLVTFTVARRGHSNEFTVLDEYNILPVMTMTGEERESQRLILFDLVLVHDSTVAVVTLRAGIDIIGLVLETTRTVENSLKSVSSILP
jgi:hypothetical protein